jgi:hypothetical protein
VITKVNSNLFHRRDQVIVMQLRLTSLARQGANRLWSEETFFFVVGHTKLCGKPDLLLFQFEQQALELISSQGALQTGSLSLNFPPWNRPELTFCIGWLSYSSTSG